MEIFLLFAAVVVGLIVLQRLGLLPSSGKGMHADGEKRQELDTDMLYGQQPEVDQMTSPRVRGDEGETTENRNSRDHDSDDLYR
jgi:hypothetical protein